MSGVHGNHGHHQHTHGLGLGHHHGTGRHAAQGDQGEAKKAGAPPASAPAAQAPATAPAATQQPSMDTAMAALDQAIQGLAANFHKDSFNGQAAPAGVTPAASTLPNTVANLNNDVFMSANQGGAAPVAQSNTLAAGDPLLDLKGGGGPAGGVNGDFLKQLGGGGPAGGVNGDRL